MPQLVKFVTPACPRCKIQSIVYLDQKSLTDWQNGVFIQDAFLDMPADERELLKTGTHPECWADIFSENA